MAGPEGDRLIRVDMTTQTVSIESFPDEWKLMGGRVLSARILRTECDPTCDPLGPNNLLVISPGALAGTAAPTSGRISIGGKSPLTGGIKEANSGGNPGQDLMKLGYRAIVVKGKPADPERRYGLEVMAGGATVVPADDYKGLWNYACCKKLLANYPKKASAISIGPAGEMQLRGASVATTDHTADRRPARHAGRGGLGAVMGSKGLKWVMVNPGKAPIRKAANPADFADLCKSYTKAYLAGPQMVKYGTASVVGIANTLNTFPYKNRTEGQSPDVSNLEGARIIESFEERGGGMHNCMTGCIVKCSNMVHNAQGEYTTSGLEFETLTLLGSNCAIQSWEDVADLDRLCDELGLDTIETGAAVAVLMDSGGLEWGDAEGTKQLLRGIAEGTEMGMTIGNGVVATGEKTGHQRVPAVKGQAIPAWDPRPLKPTGVSYATSPMGADHTAGLILNPGMPAEELARASQEMQLVTAVNDGSGLCMFLSATLDDIRSFYSQFYGEEVTREQIADLGWNCLQDEWAFNEAAGFTAEDDVLPPCVVEEGVGPDHALKFDVGPDVITATKVRFPIRDELFAIKAIG
jgi:aldehyde:ferredoxin oxidoreductase